MNADVSAERACELLLRGALTLEGRLVDASNATFFGAVSDGELTAACVYKPVRGERPLWDFPDETLARREVAAYLLSEAMGWRIVPPTVYRIDAPFDEGMVQLWIDADETLDLGQLVRHGAAPLRRMAVFDAVVNNADRKGGHLLPVAGGHVYGCDHGVCFHVEDKLRTVLWQWRGQLLEGDELDVLGELEPQLCGGDLGRDLAELLDPAEVTATVRRVQRLRSRRRFPQPSPDWPAVPWPPY